MLESESGVSSLASLIVFVVPHGKGAHIVDLAKSAHAISRIALFGHGTASREIWDRMGIPKERDIVLCATLCSRVEAVMKTVADKIEMRKPGNGFAFAVSVDRFFGKGMAKYLMERAGGANALFPGVDAEKIQEIRLKVEKVMNRLSEEKDEAQKQCPMELIVVRMASGYGQEVMDCARKAGAIGGTIVHGRTSLDSSAVKFFNITIEPESDILFMLVFKEVTDAVLEAVARQWGPHTAAHAFGFVVPVLKTMTRYE